MRNPFLISKLKKCKTGEEVDAVLKVDSNKTGNYEKEIEYIRDAMGNPALFLDKKDYGDYITTRSQFLTDSAMILRK